MQTTLYHALFLIFVGAGLMATLALYTRQSLLIAYMLVGVALGPWGLGLVREPKIVEEAGNFGIIFLLFLLGLQLNPRSLWRLLQETLLVTLISSALFGCLGFVLGYLSGFNIIESGIVGIAMMFSSTILGLKLLPTTVLHHQRIGEVAISVLLLQDIIAIFSLLALQGMSSGEGISWFLVLKILLAVPGLLVIVWALEYYFLSRLIHRFNKLHEFIFLMAIAWCLGVGELAAYLGLSFEIGAFMAGVALAASPISRFISESLKPLRDFFLILFFFSLGAEIDFHVVKLVLVPASLLALILLLAKPFVFKVLLRHTQHSESLAWELGMRLGQVSEFSLLIAYYAETMSLIGDTAYYLIQITTLMTFIASSYIIVQRYPTPIATNERLRRD